MKIILLSGGSGKRLWPLSNDARSKQFLRVLEAPDGKSESMVQRIARQIKESQLPVGLSDIILATNAAQRDSIVSQLGGEVDIVTEPKRRDTFPAIALATTYLCLQKACNPSEVVVVMPCDPYTEGRYFDVVGRMARAVEEGDADLVLMGIEPTYPSTKFGYIVPAACEGEVRSVSRFTEKPSREQAERLIAQRALWNGGVFAFRLGYLNHIVQQYFWADNFESFRARYEELPKISFDYEVAEKATSIAVVPFNGVWEDLGTWNALSCRLKSPTSGNVLLGDNVNNVHVVNELQVPLLCEGISDAIVAAAPDGILVCSKQHSELIKNYVGNLNLRPMYEERRWGTYRVLNHEVFDDGYEQLTKILTLHAGCHISYQLHHRRSEVWTITDGVGTLFLDGEKRTVRRGDVVNIQPEQRHAIKAITELTIVEIQGGTPLIEEDIERFEWPE